MRSLNKYQEKAWGTTLPLPSGEYGKDSAITYCVLKLNGEAGEVAEKWGKAMRDATPVDEQLLALELGDILWYVAVMAKHLDFTLQDIAEMNIQKLASRKQRDKLGGSGDER